MPFGKDNSWGRPLANLKLGIQYTIYTKFNGGTKNYDGFGDNASGNNTLFSLPGWLFERAGLKPGREFLMERSVAYGLGGPLHGP